VQSIYSKKESCQHDEAAAIWEKNASIVDFRIVPTGTIEVLMIMD